ncbi:MAG: glycerophosphodiester phosphodiesterase family protein [Pseudomonadota bacterium]
MTEWEYAHRGLHSDSIPENSLAASEAAIAAGMGIECDIQRSADDHPMVFHDWELERLTDGNGATENLDSNELERLMLVGTDQSPIRLSRLIETVDGRVPLLIEIKSRPGYDVERTCELVQSEVHHYAGDFAVMSFDPTVSEWFSKNSPETVRGLVCTDTLDHGWLSKWREPGELQRANPDFLAVDIRDLPNDKASGWRASGKPLLSWTIRSQQLRDRALAHVDAMISEGEGLA